ncbi:MAG: 50S ribosomal protein L21 [Planctomycetota bacterium]
MYAIAIDRNRQILVREGDTLLLDHHEAWQPGQEVTLDQVCLLGGVDEPRIGTPYVDGARVLLEVRGEQKGKKVIVGKFKRRKGYRRKTGFRAQYSRVVVKEIKA